MFLLGIAFTPRSHDVMPGVQSVINFDKERVDIQRQMCCFLLCVTMPEWLGARFLKWWSVVRGPAKVRGALVTVP